MPAAASSCPERAASRSRLADAEQISVEADVLVHRQVFVKAEALRHVAEVVLRAFGVDDHV